MYSIEREFAKRNNQSTPFHKIEYNTLCKLTRYHIRKDLSKYTDRIINENINQGSTRKIKAQLSDGKKWSIGLNNKNGDVERNRQKIIQIASTFYKELYAGETNINTETTDKKPRTNSIKPFEDFEIENIIKNLKPGKTPGSDKISNEMLKEVCNEISHPLTLLFNKLVVSREIPKQWLQTDIILLHKKGDQLNINNYRPISLTCSLNKIFMKLIFTRIESTLTSHQPIEQAGFRTTFSTQDHLQVVNQLIEKSSEYQITLYLAFIDFKKAFDSLKQVFLYKSLKHQNIPTDIIDLLKSLYANNTARIIMDRPGPYFKIQRGVKQGDPLSPILFNSALEEIFRELSWEQYGINVNGSKLNNLRFADDVVLIAKSCGELETMLHDLKQVSDNAGLIVNPAKTFLLTNHLQHPITLEGTELKWAIETIYLGQIISFQNKTSKEINRRIAIAWGKFWSLKIMLKNKALSIRNKVKIMKSCIIPTLTYGCQTWSPTKKEKQKLRSTQRAMERSILGLSKIQKIRHNLIRGKTGMDDILSTVAKLKWKWAGHLARMSDRRWTRRVTDWRPEGRVRKVGRQKLRWKDDIEDTAGSAWMRTAQDRDNWNALGEAYAQKWA